MNAPIIHNPYLIDKLVLSHSSRSSFRSCARKLEFRQFYGEPGFREDMFAADCGTALHAGFETWMMTHDEDRAILDFGIKYPLEQEFLQKDHARSLEACFTTLQALMKSELLAEYEIAQIRLPDGRVKHAVEVPFAIEITGSPFPFPVWYIGFIDAILRHRFHDKYVVSDLKTTRSWVTDLSLKYEFDEQTVPYAIILAHILGEQIDELDASYISAYIDIMEPRVSLYKIKKTQAHLQDWHLGLCDDIAQITRYFNRRWFKRATSGDTCMAFGRKCDFADFCSFRDPAVLQRMIAGKRREGLFSTGEVPWITASLPYIKLED